MEIISPTQQYAIWPVAALLLPTRVMIQWRRKRTPSYLLCLTLFGIYALVAIDKLFFPLLLITPPADAANHRWLVLQSVNLIPFHFGELDMMVPYIFMREIIGNVVLTIPFGFGLSFVARVRARDFVWIAPAVGLGIELGQFCLCLVLGMPFRSIDINDVILNTLGFWIGYGLFRAFAWLYVWAVQRVNIRLCEVAAYAHEVAIRASA